MLLRRLLIISALCCALLTLSACELFKPKLPEQGGMGMGGGIPPSAIKAWFAETRMWAPAIDLVGDVRPSKRTALTAEVAGRVMDISSREGEIHDPASGALIRIDDTHYQAMFKAAVADEAAARERLSELETGARSEDVLAMEAQVDSARANRDRAAADLERAKKLVKDGVYSQSQFDAAQAQAEATQGALDSLLEQLKKLNDGERSEVIGAARAAYQARQAQVDSARNSLERCAVNPPFRAMVSKLFVEEGQYVGPGTELAEVISSEGLEAWFDLPEYGLEFATPGSPVELRSAQLPGEVVMGSVIQVVYDADPASRQFPVRVSVEDPRLKSGYFVTGRLLTAQPQPTVVVSQDALILTNLGQSVYRLDGIQEFLGAAQRMGAGEEVNIMEFLPTAEQVLVKPGLYLDGMVAITSSEGQNGPLKPGDWIVTLGNETLFPTRPCIVSNAQEAGQAFGAFMAEMAAMQGGGAPPAGMGGGMPPQGMGEAPPEGMTGAPPAGGSPAAQPEAEGMSGD